MITTLVSVGAIALLFMLAGALRTRVGCSGNCDACGRNSCSSVNADENHVA
jgi:uncharacterized ferredoxin-like protein